MPSPWVSCVGITLAPGQRVKDGVVCILFFHVLHVFMPPLFSATAPTCALQGGWWHRAFSVHVVDDGGTPCPRPLPTGQLSCQIQTQASASSLRVEVWNTLSSRARSHFCSKPVDKFPMSIEGDTSLLQPRWTEEPGRIQSTGSQKSQNNSVTEQQQDALCERLSSVSGQVSYSIRTSPLQH